ncbi:hypothetical protein RCH33_2963 [Flavobacterium daejeonense]|nr:hypothetical protein RCH33_2963 [Flavobacterium daejeonense]
MMMIIPNHIFGLGYKNFNFIDFSFQLVFVKINYCFFNKKSLLLWL